MTSRNSTTKRKRDPLGHGEPENLSSDSDDEDSVTRHWHTFHAKETKGTMTELQKIHAQVDLYLDEVGFAAEGNELEQGQRESLKKFLSRDNLQCLKARFPNLNIQKLQGWSSDDFNNLHVEDFNSLHRALYRGIVRPLNATLEKFSEVYNDLKAMAAYANKTEIQSTVIASQEECPEDYYKDMMRGVYMDSPGPAHQVAQKHLGAFQAPPKLDPPPANLLQFASFWNDTMEQATIDEEPTDDKSARLSVTFSDGTRSG